MPQKIFVTMPVTDLARSVAFYEALGGTSNPKLNDGTSAGVEFSEAISVMLHTREKWAQFTAKPIADARAGLSIAHILSANNRGDVDRIIAAAGAAGGTPDANPPEDFGFMYSRSVEDPDGHHWDLTWADMNQMPAGE
jgi:predicted lactoylglutathione lyase